MARYQRQYKRKIRRRKRAQRNYTRTRRSAGHNVSMEDFYTSRRAYRRARPQRRRRAAKYYGKRTAKIGGIPVMTLVIAAFVYFKFIKKD